ncbi:MAG: formate dehydrogenase [Proteobacteria bacterium]|nr:MAG: formate dehydrogenase [Pseudomonadota bacterium]
MKKHKHTNARARRDFLKSSALAGAGATIASTLPGAAIAAPSEDAGDKPTDKYRVTRHIADYYKTLS